MSKILGVMKPKDGLNFSGECWALVLAANGQVRNCSKKARLAKRTCAHHADLEHLARALSFKTDPSFYKNQVDLENMEIRAVRAKWDLIERLSNREKYFLEDTPENRALIAKVQECCPGAFKLKDAFKKKEG